MGEGFSFTSGARCCRFLCRTTFFLHFLILFLLHIHFFQFFISIFQDCSYDLGILAVGNAFYQVPVLCFAFYHPVHIFSELLYIYSGRYRRGFGLFYDRLYPFRPYHARITHGAGCFTFDEYPDKPVEINILHPTQKWGKRNYQVV